MWRLQPTLCFIIAYFLGIGILLISEYFAIITAMEDDAVPVFSTLSLGSLAPLVLLLMSLFSLFFLLLFFRQQSQSQEEVHCARCQI